MEYRTGRSKSYRFTIDPSNEQDKLALQTLRNEISASNKSCKEMRDQGCAPLMRVKVALRRPELQRPENYQSKKKYGFGGNVRTSQNPKEADVYIYEVMS